MDCLRKVIGEFAEEGGDGRVRSRKTSLGSAPSVEALSSLRTRLIHLLQFLIGIIAWGVVLFVMVIGFRFGYYTLPMTDAQTAVETVVTIPAGMTTREIGRMLEEQQIIRSGEVFALISRALGVDGSLMAGNYSLSPGMNLLEIIRRLRAGEVITYRVTIPEGANIREIATILENRGLVDRERFIELAMDSSLIYGDNFPLEKPIPSLEGYLYPDTYLFTDSSEETIIKRMVDQFIKTVVPVVEQAESKYSLHEILTLASIVEKEIIYHDERALVAAVYHNRLEQGMRLQADPTIQYILERPVSRLLYSHLQIESPYNTYRNDGLPPGPIGNPGIRSIEAVLNPADVDYLFFVARGDGRHHFSRTFAEHVDARRMYQ